MAKQQVSNMNPEVFYSTTLLNPFVGMVNITLQAVMEMNRYQKPSHLHDGRVAIIHTVPYKRHCYDLYDVKTGQFIVRHHTPQLAYKAYQAERLTR